MKIIKPKENISEKTISADKNISDRESSVEAPESKDGSEATNAAPAVYAVKSKPIRQKRKYDESGKNVKKSAPPVKIPKSSTHDTMASPVKIVSKASTQVEKRVLRQTRAAPSEKSKKSTRTSSSVNAVSSASAKNTSSPNKNNTEGNHKKDRALLQRILSVVIRIQSLNLKNLHLLFFRKETGIFML
ncbi:hypothetical protein CEXT_780041 [Caerostris extrusa]|uniref:Uncharacterized protein n=1 Tax=Caerostris extrusa TaxID=172846 RepID=A0AAV4X9D2_CAEEX|nr:hypothetical protein CEXT_780041 [Caerostris extrusa]